MVFALITASSQNYFIASLELFTAEIAFLSLKAGRNVVYSILFTHPKIYLAWKDRIAQQQWY